MTTNYKGQCRTISLYPEYWERVDQVAEDLAAGGRANVSAAIRQMIDQAGVIEELDICIKACFMHKITADEAIQRLASIRFDKL